ncbi:MAG: helix-hairpin-helix domain-containing protein, partial [Haloarculaceae archaeon]
MADDESEAEYEDLTDVGGVGAEEADALREAGYGTVEDLRNASQSALADVSGIGNALAARIKADVDDIEPAEEPDPETEADVVENDAADDAETEEDEDEDEADDHEDLTDISGVGPAKADALR